jgi:hypothetical protein
MYKVRKREEIKKKKARRTNNNLKQEILGSNTLSVVNVKR